MEALNQQQQASTAQAQAAQHHAALSGLEQQFILAGHPDYYERVNFIRQRRNHELELMGYMDPTERAQNLANEAAMLVGGAIRRVAIRPLWRTNCRTNGDTTPRVSRNTSG